MPQKPKSRQSGKKNFPAAAPALPPHPHSVVADDHRRGPLWRPQHADERAGGFEVGRARRGRRRRPITQTIELEPDILVLDLLMPRLPRPRSPCGPDS